MKIKNVSPLGDLDVPLLGRIVAAGERFDVTDDDAAQLLAQPGNFEPVDNPARALEKKVRRGAEEAADESPAPTLTTDAPTVLDAPEATDEAVAATDDKEH